MLSKEGDYILNLVQCSSCMQEFDSKGEDKCDTCLYGRYTNCRVCGEIKSIFIPCISCRIDREKRQQKKETQCDKCVNSLRLFEYNGKIRCADCVVKLWKNSSNSRNKVV